MSEIRSIRIDMELRAGDNIPAAHMHTCQKGCNVRVVEPKAGMPGHIRVGGKIPADKVLEILRTLD
jgi:hypothetical protein